MSVYDFFGYHRKLEAARRALGIVNRLPPGPYKARHASRVLSAMNRLRAKVRAAERETAYMNDYMRFLA